LITMLATATHLAIPISMQLVDDDRLACFMSAVTL
jgi:hypothetical protein